MAQQTINNGDAGLDARTKINTNFLELYTGKIGTATAGTNVTWTVNSVGLSLNASGYAGIGTSMTNASATLNSNGLALSVGNYITTARASNDAVGLNTARTNVTWTVNSAGISLNASGYAGTSTGATGANVTLDSNGIAVSVLAGGGGITNVQWSAGTTYSLGSYVNFGDANGVSFGLDTINNSITASIDTSAALTNIKVSAGTSSGLRSDITFTNQNGVSFGLNAAGIISASHNGITYGAVGLNTAQTNVTWTVNSSGISLNASGYAGTGTSATNASITMNTNGLAISVAAPGGGFTYTGFDPFPMAMSATGQYGAGTLFLMPFTAPYFQADRICVPVQISNASNSSFSATLSMSAGIYTKNGNSLSRYASASATFALTASGTVGSYTQWGGVRLVTMPLTNTYEARNYWFGLWSSTTTGGGAGMTFNNLLISQLNSSYSGLIGVGTNNSMVYMLGKGISSVSFSTAMPDAVPLVDIRGNSSLWQRSPIFYFASSTL